MSSNFISGGSTDSKFEAGTPIAPNHEAPLEGSEGVRIFDDVIPLANGSGAPILSPQSAGGGGGKPPRTTIALGLGGDDDDEGGNGDSPKGEDLFGAGDSSIAPIELDGAQGDETVIFTAAQDPLSVPSADAALHETPFGGAGESEELVGAGVGAADVPLGFNRDEGVPFSLRENVFMSGIALLGCASCLLSLGVLITFMTRS